MKKIILLLIFTTLFSCGDNKISKEKIKSDLIGNSIKYAWGFSTQTEFIDMKIVKDKDLTDTDKQLIVEFILSEPYLKTIHYLKVALNYKKENNTWKYVDGDKIKLIENINNRTLE